MEYLLTTYLAPADPRRPLVCFDEAGKALQADGREPLPAQPGRVRYDDPEYVRAGSANLFVAYAPHLGWRHVTVTRQRTAVEFALAMRELVDVHFPDADQVIVVLDNLNTHHPGALYTTFPAPEAARIAAKLAFRYTPRHGSWLNMAELEWAVLQTQCLARRIPDQATLEAEVAAWEAARNAVAAPAHWSFSVDDARTHLTHLYPIPVCDTST
jgi:hypothetical protein